MNDSCPNHRGGAGSHHGYQLNYHNNSHCISGMHHPSGGLGQPNCSVYAISGGGHEEGCLRQSSQQQNPAHSAISRQECHGGGGANGDIDDYDDERMTEASGSTAPEYLTVKRWVMALFCALLLLTFSLLVGISLQHFELIKKLALANNNSESGNSDDGIYRYRPNFREKNQNYFHLTSLTTEHTTTTRKSLPDTFLENSKEDSAHSNEKHKRQTVAGVNCKSILNEPFRNSIKDTIRNFPFKTEEIKDMKEYLCTSQNESMGSIRLGNSSLNAKGFPSHGKDRKDSNLKMVCSKFVGPMLDNMKLRTAPSKILHDLQDQNCISGTSKNEVDKHAKLFSLTYGYKILRNVVNCTNDDGRDTINALDQNRFLHATATSKHFEEEDEDALGYAMIMLANECLHAKSLGIEESSTPSTNHVNTSSYRASKGLSP